MVTASGEKWHFSLMTNICGMCWCPSCFLGLWAKDTPWACVGYSLALAVHYCHLLAWEVLPSEEVSLPYSCEVSGSSLGDGPLPCVDEQIPLLW